MKALVMDRPFEMHIADRPLSPLGTGEVRVRVSAAGICMGDQHIYAGRNPYAVYPCVGGHEMAGTVEGLGASVGDLQPGDRVVVEPFMPCGSCYPCSIGKGNCCRNLSILGVHVPGGYAEFVTAPANRLHRIPDNLSMVRASFAEPLAIAVHACRRAELSSSTTLPMALVIGCGSIGLSLIEVALAKGATVFATDPAPKRLANAKSLGAVGVPSGQELTTWANEYTNGEGIPVVFEATGVPEAMSLGFSLTASGGKLVVLGLLPQGTPVTFDGLDLTRKEATILGSRASTECFPEAIDLLGNPALKYPDVATTASMWDGPELFSELFALPGMMQKGVLIP